MKLYFRIQEDPGIQDGRSSTEILGQKFIMPSGSLNHFLYKYQSHFACILCLHKHHIQMD